jgi:hypothetical protein
MVLVRRRNTDALWIAWMYDPELAAVRLAVASIGISSCRIAGTRRILLDCKVTTG